VKKSFGNGIKNLKGENIVISIEEQIKKMDMLIEYSKEDLENAQEKDSAILIEVYKKILCEWESIKKSLEILKKIKGMAEGINEDE
jgi:hypothetical protein